MRSMSTHEMLSVVAEDAITRRQQEARDQKIAGVTSSLAAIATYNNNPNLMKAAYLGSSLYQVYTAGSQLLSTFTAAKIAETTATSALAASGAAATGASFSSLLGPVGMFTAAAFTALSLFKKNKGQTDPQAMAIMQHLNFISQQLYELYTEVVEIKAYMPHILQYLQANHFLIKQALELLTHNHHQLIETLEKIDVGILRQGLILRGGQQDIFLQKWYDVLSEAQNIQEGKVHADRYPRENVNRQLILFCTQHLSAASLTGLHLVPDQNSVADPYHSIIEELKNINSYPKLATRYGYLARLASDFLKVNLNGNNLNEENINQLFNPWLWLHSVAAYRDWWHSQVMNKIPYIKQDDHIRVVAGGQNFLNLLTALQTTPQLYEKLFEEYENTLKEITVLIEESFVEQNSRLSQRYKERYPDTEAPVVDIKLSLNENAEGINHPGNNIITGLIGNRLSLGATGPETTISHWGCWVTYNWETPPNLSYQAIDVNALKILFLGDYLLIGKFEAQRALDYTLNYSNDTFSMKMFDQVVYIHFFEGDNRFENLCQLREKHRPRLPVTYEETFHNDFANIKNRITSEITKQIISHRKLAYKSALKKIAGLNDKLDGIRLLLQTYLFAVGYPQEKISQMRQELCGFSEIYNKLKDYIESDNVTLDTAFPHLSFAPNRTKVKEEVLQFANSPGSDKIPYFNEISLEIENLKMLNLLSQQLTPDQDMKILLNNILEHYQETYEIISHKKYFDAVSSEDKYKKISINLNSTLAETRSLLSLATRANNISDLIKCLMQINEKLKNCHEKLLHLVPTSVYRFDANSFSLDSYAEKIKLLAETASNQQTLNDSLFAPDSHHISVNSESSGSNISASSSLEQVPIHHPNHNNASFISLRQGSLFNPIRATAIAESKSAHITYKIT